MLLFVVVSLHTFVIHLNSAYAWQCGSFSFFMLCTIEIDGLHFVSFGVFRICVRCISLRCVFFFCVFVLLAVVVHVCALNEDRFGNYRIKTKNSMNSEFERE